MATPTRADKFITLRQRYERDALTLRAQQVFASEREERQVSGRYQVLERVALDLVSIIHKMKAARVQMIIEGVLEYLAEQKATWLVNSIRRRSTDTSDELGAWLAKGAIAQIDAIVPELCARLSLQWNLTSRMHECYFHVYHSTDLAALLDPAIGKQRWQGPGREQYYREVAIIKVPRSEHQLEEVYCLSSDFDWNRTHHRDLAWVQESKPVRSTSVGDIIVSLLSGTAWIKRNIGFQVIEQGAVSVRELVLANDEAGLESLFREVVESNVPTRMVSLAKEYIEVYLEFDRDTVHNTCLQSAVELIEGARILTLRWGKE